MRGWAIYVSLLLFSSGQTLWPKAEVGYALVHVNVVDIRNGRINPNVTGVISGSTIKSVRSDRTAHIPAHTRVLDCRGKYVLPGLWDMHVHTEGNPRVLRQFLAAGITGIRDMGGDVHKLSEARAQVAAGDWRGPQLLIAGPLLQGPPGTSDDDTWILHSPEEVQRAIATLSTFHVKFIKVHDRLSKEVYYAIASAAKERGLPFVGHVPASITPAQASAAGQASIEHFEFLPKECVLLLNQIAAFPRPAECTQPSIDKLLQLFATNDTWLDPTIQSFRFWAPAQWKAISNSFGQIVVSIRRQHVRILAGTDWSGFLESKGDLPGRSLHDELELLVAAGFTPLESLQAATINPAIFLGLESLGAVEEGKEANLLLLKANPLINVRNTRQIVAVISRGKFLRPSQLNDTHDPSKPSRQ